MIVNVLLSSYNGEKYIKEQIESIASQTLAGVGLTVRDDGSKDKTLEIVNEFKDKIPLKIIQGGNLRCAKSFWELVNLCDDAEYYAFCDQDDVWDSEKLYNAVNALKERENNIPLLFFSDVKVVDEELNLIREGMAEDFPISYAHSYLRNIAPGCTYVFNHKARELLKKFKPEQFGPLLHDWVAYRIISGTGEVVFDKKCYMQYRQHGNNEVGATATGIKYKLRIFKTAFNRVLKNKDKNERSIFAREILQTYMDDLTPEAKEITEELALYTKDKKLKRKLLKDERFYFKGFRYKYFKWMIRVNRV